MNPLNERLRETFHFSSRDLLSNRAGQLSPRQKARQGALVSNMLLGIGIFCIIMIGTLGVIWYGSAVSGSAAPAGSSDDLIGGGIVVGITLLIVIVGSIAGLRQVRMSNSGQVHKAEGIAQRGKTRADAGVFEIKIGETGIRLLTDKHREVFKVGTLYRVYYTPASVPTILSAEVIGTESEANETLAPEAPIEKDVILIFQRNARRVGIVLPLLVLGIPLVLFATGSLPGWLRLVIWLLLLIASFAFVAWALRSTGNDE